MIGKLILVGALLASLVAAAVSYNTSVQLRDARAELDSKSADLTKAQKEASKTKEELQTAIEQASTLESTSKSLQAEAQAAKEAAAKAEAEAKEATAKLNDALAGGEEARTKLAEIESKLPPGQSIDDITTELERLDKAAQAASKDSEAKSAQISDLKVQLENMMEAQKRTSLGINPPGLRGRVVALDSNWNFVVLNIGEQDGLIPNSELTVLRGAEPVAQLRVARVEDKTAVADVTRIVENAGISVGDTVVSNRARN